MENAQWHRSRQHVCAVCVICEDLAMCHTQVHCIQSGRPAVSERACSCPEKMTQLTKAKQHCAGQI